MSRRIPEDWTCADLTLVQENGTPVPARPGTHRRPEAEGGQDHALASVTAFDSEGRFADGRGSP
jgi:hypothetical protein